MSKRNLYFAASIACLTGALFGYSVGFIGGILVLPSFLHHFGLDELAPADLASSQALIVSAWIIGAFCGVPLGLPVCSKFGRKACLIFSSAIYVFGAALQLVDLHTGVRLFEFARFLNGLGIGAATLAMPIYMAEIARPDDRGTLMSGFQVSVQIFALIGFWGAYASNSIFEDTSKLQWQLPVAVQLIPGAVMLLGTFYIPETPHYLAQHGSRGDMRKSLAWLRGLDEEDTELIFEATQIESNVTANLRTQQLHNQTSFIREAFSKPVRKRLGVGIGLMIAQNMVGLNALNYYAAVIFITAGFKSISASLFLTGVFGLVKVISSAAFMFVFVHVRGNRFWLKLGSLCCGVTMLILGFCVGTMNHNAADENQTYTVKGLVAVLMVYVFAFFFGVSLGPISWNVCSEIFPSRINTKCCMITTCTQWLFQIVIASITPLLLNRIGAGTFIFYGVCCFISLAWCWFCVPETRGVAIGKEMDEVFGDDTKDDNVPVVEEVEDVSEETPLMSHAARARRRRSSVAIIV